MSWVANFLPARRSADTKLRFDNPKNGMLETAASVLSGTIDRLMEDL